MCGTREIEEGSALLFFREHTSGKDDPQVRWTSDELPWGVQALRTYLLLGERGIGETMFEEDKMKKDHSTAPASSERRRGRIFFKRKPPGWEATTRKREGWKSRTSSRKKQGRKEARRGVPMKNEQRTSSRGLLKKGRRESPTKNKGDYHEKERGGVRNAGGECA